MPGRILIVDDEPLILDGFDRALQIEGHAVWTATKPQEALRLCDENSFDLVIVDFLMPTMNGVELLTRIRKRQPQVRSIIISGKVDAEVDESQLSKSLGEWVEADLYLHKPVAAPKLREAVASLLSAELPADWRRWAQKTLKAQELRIKSAKEASKKLKSMKKRKDP